MQIDIRKVDHSRIEIRTVHEIAPPVPKCGFELSAYFFIPSKLAHGGDELDGAQALTQTAIFPKIQRKNYYEIFAMSLSAILDAENGLSPLTRLEQMAEKVLLPIEEVFYELQMLVCVTKNACSNACKSQIQRIHTRSKPSNSVPQQKVVQEVQAEFLHISKCYLQLQNRLEQLGERYSHEVMQNVHETYRWTLEDLNHQILGWMIRAQRLGEQYQFCTEYHDFLTAELELQWLYQKRHGFATLSDDEYNNESYLFHLRELKSWRYSGLSMSSTETKRQSVIAHFWFSMASAVAMIFALAVTLLSMYIYGQWSMPFLVFAVLGYMFKDRIKEILRSLFSNKFSKYSLFRLYDPRSKSQCGSIRESLDACDELPSDILTLRRLHKHPLSSRYNREIAIVYHESLKLNSQRLFKTHRRLQSGCQILEFNLAPYLQNIKESEAKQLWHPVEEHPHYQKLKIKRSYHLTLVIKARPSNGQDLSERYRIVLRGSKIAWIKKII